MAWCCQAPSHYLDKCRPSSMTPYGVTRPQWVKLYCGADASILSVPLTMIALHHRWYLQWSLQWRHNGCDGVSNHQPHDCFLNRLFRRRSKKTSKLRVTGLCAGNSPGTGEFPTQIASNAEHVSIWWRQHVLQFKPFRSERNIRYSHPHIV